MRRSYIELLLCVFLAAGSSPFGARERVIVRNGTVLSDRGTLLRGVTMELDEPGAPSSNAALDPSHWKAAHDLKLNVVRFDVKLSAAHMSLKDQLPSIDKAVNLAAQNDMYIALMNSTRPGNHNTKELQDFWSVVAQRYKDRTHVLYEMVNEPVAWEPRDYKSQDIFDLKSVYHIMRSKAPQTHIVLWDFANLGVGDGHETVGKISKMSGVDYSNTSVGFHYYTTSKKQITTIKSTYPVFMTETSPGDKTDDIENLKNCERVGVSWISLEGKQDNFDRMQKEILPALHSSSS